MSFPSPLFEHIAEFFLVCEEFVQRDSNKIFQNNVWLLRLGIVRLGTFACDLSLEMFRSGISFGTLRLEIVVWDLSLGNFALGSVAVEFSL